MFFFRPALPQHAHLFFPFIPAPCPLPWISPQYPSLKTKDNSDQSVNYFGGRAMPNKAWMEEQVNEWRNVPSLLDYYRVYRTKHLNLDSSPGSTLTMCLQSNKPLRASTSSTIKEVFLRAPPPFFSKLLWFWNFTLIDYQVNLFTILSSNIWKMK